MNRKNLSQKAVVSRNELEQRHGRLKRMAPKAGTEAHSLLCVLAAMLGNWPRVKSESWEKANIRYATLMRREVTEEEPRYCELCVDGIASRTIGEKKYRVCQACRKNFGPTEKGTNIMAKRTELEASGELLKDIINPPTDAELLARNNPSETEDESTETGRQQDQKSR